MPASAGHDVPSNAGAESFLAPSLSWRQVFPGAKSFPAPSLSRRQVFLRVPRFVRQHARIDPDLAQRTQVFLLDVAAEHQIRIGVAVQPAIVLDFGLELSRRPAGIAEREDGVLWAGALGNRLEN